MRREKKRLWLIVNVHIWIPEHWTHWLLLTDCSSTLWIVCVYRSIHICAGIEYSVDFNLHEQENLRSLHYCWLVADQCDCLWHTFSWPFPLYIDQHLKIECLLSHLKKKRNLLISDFRKGTQVNSIGVKVLLCAFVLVFHSGSKDTTLKLSFEWQSKSRKKKKAKKNNVKNGKVKYSQVLKTESSSNGKIERTGTRKDNLPMKRAFFLATVQS